MAEEREELKGEVIFYSARFPQQQITMVPKFSPEKQGQRTAPGKRLTFRDGFFITADKAEIEFLRDLPEFGQDFVELKDRLQMEALKKPKKEVAVKQGVGSSRAAPSDLVAPQDAPKEAKAARVPNKGKRVAVKA